MRRGRPRVPPDVVALVLELRDSGRSWGEIAVELRIARSTARTVYVNSRKGSGGRTDE